MNPTPAHLHASDIRGAARLIVEGVTQTTSLVEAMHLNIASAAWPLGPALQGQTQGITGLVYRSIRGITGLVGAGLDGVLEPLAQLIPAQASSPQREALIAALNGVLGDHLQASGNPLAIQMRFRQQGLPLDLDREALSRQIAAPKPRLLVMVHGLCMNDLQWQRNHHDHGAALAEASDCAVLYLHYNSGRHISENGREFAQQLEQLLQAWPVPVTELRLVGHSMGGLVSRSAYHYAQQDQLQWPARLKQMFFLGTPHHGAPLERLGNRLQNFIAQISPYVAPFARLGKIRSAGITDLRFGNLLDEDWQHTSRFEHGSPSAVTPSLPPVPCYAFAATLGQQLGDAKDRLLADGLVPVNSALGVHAEAGRNLGFPEHRRWLGFGIDHWDLLDHPEVFKQLLHWLGTEDCAPQS